MRGGGVQSPPGAWDGQIHPLGLVLGLDFTPLYAWGHARGGVPRPAAYWVRGVWGGRVQVTSMAKFL